MAFSHSEFFGGGRNLGPVFGGGWRSSHLLFLSGSFSARGIHHTIGFNTFDAADGDAMAALGYGYHFFQGGGGKAASDEGKGLATLQFIDRADLIGTLLPGSTNTRPNIHLQGGAPTTADGSTMLDLSHEVAKGRFDGSTWASLTGVPTTGVSGNALPLTSAWGVTTEEIRETGMTPDHQSAVERVRVTLGTIQGKTQVFKPGFAIIAGPEFAEQLAIEVSAPSNGEQVLSFNHHYPHSKGARIFQGGLAGTFLSADEVFDLTRRLPTYQGESGGRRTAFHVYGSLTGRDLIWARDRLSSAIYPVALGDGESGISANGGFHIFEGAEIVANLSASHNPQLEPNPWSWAPGDTVENAHSSANLLNGWQEIAHVTSPCTETCLWDSVLYDGAAASNAFKPLMIWNRNPVNAYLEAGGPLSSPDAMTIQGPHGRSIKSEVIAGGALIEVPRELGSGMMPFDLFRLFDNVGRGNLPGAHRLTFVPLTRKLLWDGDLDVPNWSGPVLSRSAHYRFGYNGAFGSPGYVGFSNNPSGGYGTGDTWVSLDGAVDGDHLGNLQLHSVKPDNGWTGICSGGRSIEVKSGIVVGCR